PTQRSDGADRPRPCAAREGGPRRSAAAAGLGAQRRRRRASALSGGGGGPRRAAAAAAGGREDQRQPDQPRREPAAPRPAGDLAAALVVVRPAVAHLAVAEAREPGRADALLARRALLGAAALVADGAAHAAQAVLVVGAQIAGRAGGRDAGAVLAGVAGPAVARLAAARIEGDLHRRARRVAAVVGGDRLDGDRAVRKLRRVDDVGRHLELHPGHRHAVGGDLEALEAGVVGRLDVDDEAGPDPLALRRPRDRHLRRQRYVVLGDVVGDPAGHHVDPAGAGVTRAALDAPRGDAGDHLLPADAEEAGPPGVPLAGVGAGAAVQDQPVLHLLDAGGDVALGAGAAARIAADRVAPADQVERAADVAVVELGGEVAHRLDLGVVREQDQGEVARRQAPVRVVNLPALGRDRLDAARVVAGHGGAEVGRDLGRRRVHAVGGGEDDPRRHQ